MSVRQQQTHGRPDRGWDYWVTRPTSRPAPKRVLSLGSIVALSSLAGVITYGITYLAGNTFYGHFGVDPEDVGFTQQRALAHAGFLLIAFLLITFFFLLIPLVI